MVKGLNVYGGEGGIGALNHHVKHEDKFKVGSLDVTALSTPCHTSGHVCYYVENDQGVWPIMFYYVQILVYICIALCRFNIQFTSREDVPDILFRDV